MVCTALFLMFGDVLYFLYGKLEFQCSFHHIISILKAILEFQCSFPHITPILAALQYLTLKSKYNKRNQFVDISTILSVFDDAVSDRFCSDTV